MSQELILGTSFVTRIYPFEASEIGVTTKIMGTKLTFELLNPIKRKRSPRTLRKYYSKNYKLNKK